MALRNILPRPCLDGGRHFVRCLDPVTMDASSGLAGRHALAIDENLSILLGRVDSKLCLPRTPRAPVIYSLPTGRAKVMRAQRGSTTFWRVHQSVWAMSVWRQSKSIGTGMHH